MDKVRCIVGITINIYEPGDTILEHHLQDEFDYIPLWHLPSECSTVYDCVSPHGKERTLVFDQNGSHYEEQTRYRFDKWAVYFEFSHTGNIWHEFQRAAHTPLEWEQCNSGAEGVFRGWEETIIEMADDLFISQSKYPMRSVQIVTVWEYESGWSRGFDWQEWETNWWPVGRLELGTMQIVKAS